ncbi:PTS lactose/cellobiose transporter subunit IIA [Fundicoccus culcitae]|uniref:PTS lactose/cellobiose transporter subunit IIA n=1 Tax=Fundicoccus culcitae TaxID=2969821 RepID=A0ABY5P931_9LACT|nr:PTS lactose/cellobiose transporter subunit IIA [Fundicoccus culcitae]UUX35179.1 PTS lactose/cellobiose transporter subunit IIA [Fundicoccus culcitae]
MEEMEQIIFEIISNGGNAKGLAYEAIMEAEKGNYEKADELLVEADAYLKTAHQVQTNLIQEEAAGKNHDVTVLFVHAQDHLMTSMEVRSLADYFIKLNKRVNELENK